MSPLSLSLFPACAMSAAPPDYYAILGVAPEADATELKKAYRREAMKHHPDKNPDRVNEATVLFQKIGEAYTVLSDPATRAAYDGRDSSADAATSWIPSGFDARDLFRDVFGEAVVAGLAAAGNVFADAGSAVVGGVASTVHGAASATASAFTNASDSVAQNGVVRWSVGAGLGSLSAQAESEMNTKAAVEARCRAIWEDRVRTLEEHEAQYAGMKLERDNAHSRVSRTAMAGAVACFLLLPVLVGVSPLLPVSAIVVAWLLEVVFAMFVLQRWIRANGLLHSNSLFDQAEIDVAEVLRLRVREARRAWEAANASFYNSEYACRVAREEEAEVERAGATLAGTVRVVGHLLGSIASRASTPLLGQVGGRQAREPDLHRRSSN